MVDVASIVISIVSVVGALLAAGITGWFAIYSDQRKRLSESEKLIAKYRDPLLLAAKDLQSRFYNILEQGLLSYIHGPGEWKDILLLYTAFLVGQYFSWVYVLRRQAQFLCFSTDKDNLELAKKLDEIQRVFSTDGYGPAGAPFMLWRGQQMAIGEIMTVKEDGELFCMGYAAFKQKWLHDDVFRGWFQSIEEGIILNAEARSQHAAMIPDRRLRHLQHLLLDLIYILEPKRLRSGGSWLKRCGPAPECACSECSALQVKNSGERNQV